MAAPAGSRNPRGNLAGATAFTASDAKNAFGRLLETAERAGMVTITRHNQPKAVLLSIDEYRALAGAPEDALGALSDEFDAMLDRMQAAGARDAMQAAFDTPPHELGRIAVKGARRKRG